MLHSDLIVTKNLNISLTNFELKYLELELINKSVFKSCGLELTSLELEKESHEYFAHNFKLNNLGVKFRIAKVTPTKIGQFVTLWQRNDKGIMEPFSLQSNFDFCIIAVRKEANLGIFIFSKSVLYEHQVLSDNTRDGKRAIRVYPTWDKTTNKQAQKTQQWQSRYFIDLSENIQFDLEKAKGILNLM